VQLQRHAWCVPAIHVPRNGRIYASAQLASAQNPVSSSLLEVHQFLLHCWKCTSLLEVHQFNPKETLPPNIYRTPSLPCHFQLHDGNPNLNGTVKMPVLECSHAGPCETSRLCCRRRLNSQNKKTSMLIFPWTCGGKTYPKVTNRTVVEAADPFHLSVVVVEGSVLLEMEQGAANGR
jgi:hypothetical protein